MSPDDHTNDRSSATASDATPETEYPGRDGRATALVVAHPGHEMRLHAWMERVRPRVFVLTDGSGHGDRGRLASTSEVLARVGASEGSIFGRFSDRDAYRLLFDADLDPLEAAIRELADHFEEARVEAVVSDAVEGFNPVHDLCFLLAETAAKLAAERLGRELPHFDFWLEAAPDAAGDPSLEVARLRLAPEEVERKLQSARSYVEMREEVDRLLALHGTDAFAVEVMRRVPDLAWADRVGSEPFYETHGERRVAEGVYSRVLRFREHFLPVVEALRGRIAM